MVKVDINNADGLQLYNSAQHMLQSFAMMGFNEPKRAIAAATWSGFATQFGFVQAVQTDVEPIRDIWAKINNRTATLSEVMTFLGSISATTTSA